MTSPKHALIAVMGPTGTGKSTFIKLLTRNKDVIIGHKPDSETAEIQTFTYRDVRARRDVNLIDTPGFDDSRDGVTDTDILRVIASFMQQEGGKKLNGIVYMHRISDPRVGGVSKRNIRMFRELCGKEQLRSVRIVTTNWSRVTKEEGSQRLADLASGAFKSLIDAGAQLLVHDNTFDSAQRIVSELISDSSVTTQDQNDTSNSAPGDPPPLPFKQQPLLLQLQKELNQRKKLAKTSAGKVLTDEMKKHRKAFNKELTVLQKEVSDAAKAEDVGLKAELTLEYRQLQQKINREKKDKRTLQKTLLVADGQKDVGHPWQQIENLFGRLFDRGKLTRSKGMEPFEVL